VGQLRGAAMNKAETVSLQKKFSLFTEHYKPHIIGEVNDAYVKAVKFKGPFLWHHHEDEDELFLVVKGTLRMKFRDHESVVREGEFIIVPRKVEHMPEADEEVHVILIEPKTTLNTGNVTNERTQPQLKTI
jgi:mannose-6-phosphate isomerase-like protein (cupin superfamily)